jgi:5'(3')-deoxyribonucleotidase
MKDVRKIVYVDMDDTLCDFTGPFKRDQYSINFPQSRIGFFIDLEPIMGAIEGVKKLQTKYDVWILTRPSIKNIHCYTEKAEWIRKYFGEDMLNRMILCPDKSLVKGDYLIDDDNRHGQSEFEGLHIHFGTDDRFMTWSDITNYLLKD